MNAWTVTNGLNVYSSGSIGGPWRLESTAPFLAPYNQPRVIGPVTDGPTERRWRMYIQFPLKVATSASPIGPWKLKPGEVAVDAADPGDVNAFLDDDGQSYVVYTSRPDYRMRVQRLRADGRAGVPGATSPPVGRSPCEAPVLFRRRDDYFMLFGHNCWCCAEGAEVFVFRAPSPLGPWTALGDANVGASPTARLISGQTAFVIGLGAATNGSQMLALDEWMTGSTRASMRQFWTRLRFGTDSGGRQTILPLSNASRWQLPQAASAVRPGRMPPTATPDSPPPTRRSPL